MRLGIRKGSSEAIANEAVSNLFEGAAARPMWPTNIRSPTTRQIEEKGNERNGIRILSMELKVTHHTTTQNEKAERTKDPCTGAGRALIDLAGVAKLKKPWRDRCDRPQTLRL